MQQMRTLMNGSSGRNFMQSRPRSRVMNPNPARISAVIINARVTTNFTGRPGHMVRWRRHVNSQKYIKKQTSSYVNTDCWESYAFKFTWIWKWVPLNFYSNAKISGCYWCYYLFKCWLLLSLVGLWAKCLAYSGG